MMSCTTHSSSNLLMLFIQQWSYLLNRNPTKLSRCYTYTWLAQKQISQRSSCPIGLDRLNFADFSSLPSAPHCLSHVVQGHTFCVQPAHGILPPLSNTNLVSLNSLEGDRRPMKKQDTGEVSSIIYGQLRRAPRLASPFRKATGQNT